MRHVPRVALMALAALILVAPAQAVRTSHTQTLVLGIVQHGTTRKANSERSAGLRDFVRREVWMELR